MRYEELRAAMTVAGKTEVAGFFGSMAHFSRLHLDEALQHGAWHDVPEMERNAYRWSSGDSPEAPRVDKLSDLTDLQSALLYALEGEHRSHLFYSQIAERSRDPDVQQLAAEFAAEEAGHVTELQQWLARKTVTS